MAECNKKQQVESNEQIRCREERIRQSLVLTSAARCSLEETLGQTKEYNHDGIEAWKCGELFLQRLKVGHATEPGFTRLEAALIFEKIPFCRSLHQHLGSGVEKRFDFVAPFNGDAGAYTTDGTKPDAEIKMALNRQVFQRTEDDYLTVNVDTLWSLLRAVGDSKQHQASLCAFKSKLESTPFCISCGIHRSAAETGTKPLRRTPDGEEFLRHFDVVLYEQNAAVTYYFYVKESQSYEGDAVKIGASYCCAVCVHLKNGENDYEAVAGSMNDCDYKPAARQYKRIPTSQHIQNLIAKIDDERKTLCGTPFADNAVRVKCAVEGHYHEFDKIEHDFDSLFDFGASYGNEHEHHPKYKTELCKCYEDGYCERGSTCGFAHGIMELRKLPMQDCATEASCQLKQPTLESTQSVADSSIIVFDKLGELLAVDAQRCVKNPGLQMAMIFSSMGKPSRLCGGHPWYTSAESCKFIHLCQAHSDNERGTNVEAARKATRTHHDLDLQRSFDISDLQSMWNPTPDELVATLFGPNGGVTKKVLRCLSLNRARGAVYNETLRDIVDGCRSTLEFLTVDGCNEITNEGLAHLSRGLSRLKHLSVAHCSGITDDGLKNLSSLKSLESLNLSGCGGVTDETLSLPAVESLKYLNLSKCDKITESGFGRLSRLKGLKSLDLSHTRITDGKHLSSLLSLTSLSLCGCLELDGKSFSTHCVLERLTFLDVSYSRMTDEALASLARESLKSLNLAGCTATDQGLKRLGEFVHLESLNLSHSTITDETLSLIDFKNMKCLNLSHCEQITDDGHQRLMKFERLELLDLSFSSITDKAFCSVKPASMRCLKSLNLSGCRLITNAALAQLSLKGLESLNLSKCNITNDGLMRLRLEKLKSLNLSECDITMEVLRCLPWLGSLKSLNVSHCRTITDAGLKGVSRLENLESLNVSGCLNITDEGVREEILHIHNLQSLIASDCEGIKLKILPRCGHTGSEGRFCSYCRRLLLQCQHSDCGAVTLCACGAGVVSPFLKPESKTQGLVNDRATVWNHDLTQSDPMFLQPGTQSIGVSMFHLLQSNVSDFNTYTSVSFSWACVHPDPFESQSAKRVMRRLAATSKRASFLQLDFFADALPTVVHGVSAKFEELWRSRLFEAKFERNKKRLFVFIFDAEDTTTQFNLPMELPSNVIVVQLANAPLVSLQERAPRLLTWMSSAKYTNLQKLKDHRDWHVVTTSCCRVGENGKKCDKTAEQATLCARYAKIIQNGKFTQTYKNKLVIVRVRSKNEAKAIGDTINALLQTALGKEDAALFPVIIDGDDFEQSLTQGFVLVIRKWIIGNIFPRNIAIYDVSLKFHEENTCDFDELHREILPVFTFASANASNVHVFVSETLGKVFIGPEDLQEFYVAVNRVRPTHNGRHEATVDGDAAVASESPHHRALTHFELRAPSRMDTHGAAIWLMFCVVSHTQDLARAATRAMEMDKSFRFPDLTEPMKRLFNDLTQLSYRQVPSLGPRFLMVVELSFGPFSVAMRRDLVELSADTLLCKVFLVSRKVYTEPLSKNDNDHVDAAESTTEKLEQVAERTRLWYVVLPTKDLISTEAFLRNFPFVQDHRLACWSSNEAEGKEYSLTKHLTDPRLGVLLYEDPSDVDCCSPQELLRRISVPFHVLGCPPHPTSYNLYRKLAFVDPMKFRKKLLCAFWLMLLLWIVSYYKVNSLCIPEKPGTSTFKWLPPASIAIGAAFLLILWAANLNAPFISCVAFKLAFPVSGAIAVLSAACSSYSIPDEDYSAMTLFWSYLFGVGPALFLGPLVLFYLQNKIADPYYRWALIVSHNVGLWPAFIFSAKHLSACAIAILPSLLSCFLILVSACVWMAEYWGVFDKMGLWVRTPR